MKCSDCISQFAKYVILTFNGFMGVCALTLIVFGIIYMFFYEQHGLNVFSDIVPLGALAIGVGVFMLFVSAFGCCGALHQNTCLLTIYAVVLVLLSGLQFALGILVVLKFIDEDVFFDLVHKLIQNLFDKTDPDSTNSFYNIQAQFECCGVDGSNDYSIDYNGYPPSCCEGKLNPCFDPFKTGCAEAFTDATKMYLMIIGWVSIGFAALEVLAVIFAFLVRRENLKNDFRFQGGPTKEESSI